MQKVNRQLLRYAPLAAQCCDWVFLILPLQSDHNYFDEGAISAILWSRRKQLAFQWLNVGGPYHSHGDTGGQHSILHPNEFYWWKDNEQMKKILDLFSKGVHARDNDGWNGVLQPNVNQKPIFSKGVHARDHDGWNGLLLPYVNWKPIFKFNARNILFPPTNIQSLCYWRTG